MDRIYRLLLIAVCSVGILFGLQYFLPITAQYFKIEGVSGIPGLPSMPTFVYEATVEPLPLVTLEVTPPTPGGLFVFATAATIPGATATASLTSVPGATSIPASATLRGGTVASRTPGVASLPTFTPIPIPSSTPNVGGPCNNVLYPVKTGQGWSYRINAQGRSLQVNMVVAEVNGQQAKVDVTNLATGGFSRTRVDCDNGVIRSFPSVVGGLLLNNITLGSLNVEYVSGVLAPSQAAFENANWSLKWTGTYNLSGSAIVPFQGNNFNLVLNNSPLTLTCQTTASGDAAFGAITVTAGTFPYALTVICVVASQVTGTVNGQAVSGTIAGRSTQWFGLNTGLLKMQVDSASFNILGISLPLNLDSQVELLHFQPAP